MHSVLVELEHAGLPGSALEGSHGFVAMYAVRRFVGE